MTEPYSPGAPNWIDLGTTDVDGSHQFYGQVFGWTTQQLGQEAGGYGYYLKDGKRVGGFGPATDPSRGTSWAVYFATLNAGSTARLVASNGGKAVLDPMQIFDSGTMAVFLDPTGAYFSVWQPDRHRGAEITSLPGSMTWAELYTTDIEAAKGFYSAVLTLSTRDVSMGEGPPYTLFESGGVAVAGAMPGPSSYWSVYFEVDDTDAVADKAVSLGAAEILRDDSAAGRLAILTDPQGGMFGIIKSNPDFQP